MEAKGLLPFCMSRLEVGTLGRGAVLGLFSDMPPAHTALCAHWGRWPCGTQQVRSWLGPRQPQEVGPPRGSPDSPLSPWQAPSCRTGTARLQGSPWPLLGTPLPGPLPISTLLDIPRGFSPEMFSLRRPAAGSHGPKKGNWALPVPCQLGTRVPLLVWLSGSTRPGERWLLVQHLGRGPLGSISVTDQAFPPLLCLLTLLAGLWALSSLLSCPLCGSLRSWWVPSAAPPDPRRTGPLCL